jgi:DNA (cytosine-5)-methyltransferase 1
MSKPCDVFSFFSGLGFLDLGFEDEGFNVEFVNEFHPPFLSAYKHARERLEYDLPKYGYLEGSIEKILEDPKHSKEFDSHLSNSRKQGNLVGFIGGPPCPDFSIAGKQKGALGSNGRLSRIYADLILAKKPDWFLFENVKGLWGTKKHRVFYEELKRDFQKAGYTISEKLVNSAWYGVPQDRDRIIMIGFKNGNALSESDWKSGFLHAETILDEDFWPSTDSFGGKPKIHPKVPRELTVGHWFSKNAVSTHPNAKNHFTPRAGLVRFEKEEEGDDSKKSYKRLHRHRYSPTAAYGNNEVHLHPWLPRRISASEALAIQSLPSNFELPSTMTLSNMFKGIGNGVPYLMGKGIAKMILQKL